MADISKKWEKMDGEKRREPNQEIHLQQQTIYTLMYI